ncbi:Hypothetical predicted protein [Pelobates cultripes]|uniref:Uncharacterized protein n=1 Tax=Pelobates cultripes TaxID=61616 RepID=A0AAD1S478_PELCU|nr:Hypothetical predicted protein [Pelobates cultripes]
MHTGRVWHPSECLGSTREPQQSLQKMAEQTLEELMAGIQDAARDRGTVLEAAGQDGRGCRRPCELLEAPVEQGDPSTLKFAHIWSS